MNWMWWAIGRRAMAQEAYRQKRDEPKRGCGCFGCSWLTLALLLTLVVVVIVEVLG